MKNILTYLILLIVAMGCGDSNKASKKEQEALDWMIEITQIDLPPNTKRLDYYPYIEYGKLFKFLIDSSSINNFIDKHNLKAINTLNNCLVLINEVEDSWYDRDLDDIPSEEFFLLNNCKPHYAWNIMIKKVRVSYGTRYYTLMLVVMNQTVTNLEKKKQLTKILQKFTFQIIVK